MSFNQSTKSEAAMCLWFVQEGFKVSHMYASAYDAYNATKLRHNGDMPNYDVPVWFDHYGTYGEPPIYKNWGHVVAWIASKGKFLSSPGTGYGQQWFDTIQEIENYYKCKYICWSEDISNVILDKGIVMEKITKDQENVCSVMKTGGYPGKGYDYRFTGLPLTQANLDAMLNFWQSIPRPNESQYIKINDLYIKKG